MARRGHPRREIVRHAARGNPPTEVMRAACYGMLENIEGELSLGPVTHKHESRLGYALKDAGKRPGELRRSVPRPEASNEADD